VFDRIFVALATEGRKPERVVIDATHLKAHRTAASLAQKGALPAVWDEQKGGLNSKLHAVCDEAGTPILLHLTAGQVSDHKGPGIRR
jgi:Transposase DDE domain